jgi:hypothetical protein
LPDPVVSVSFGNLDLEEHPLAETAHILADLHYNLAVIQFFRWELHFAPPCGVHHCSFRILQHSS